MPVNATWATRDLPVLDATVDLFNELGHPGVISVSSIADRTHRSAQDVFDALQALQPEYVTMHMVLAGGDPNPQMVTGVTAAARRVTGQWPPAADLTDGLLLALQQALDQETDVARKSKLRSAADALAGMGRDVLVAIVASALTSHR